MELQNKSVMKIQNNDAPVDLNISLEFMTDSENKEPFDEGVVEILNHYKQTIDTIQNIKEWDYYKKLSNPYELINCFVKNKSINLGIGNYNSISRAFYKFWEIIFDFNLIDNSQDQIIYGALAEGPGGFIEAFSFYRRKYSSYSHNDIINCITLNNDHDVNIPSWKNVPGCKYNVSWGKDGTGNLYNLDNIIHFSNLFKNKKAHLVTADGGFDFSNDYTNQELSVQRLIFSEIVTALSILADNGHLVIKIFDIFFKSTVDILYILSLYFEEICIVKPNTSRPANSEKYLVCKYFKGIPSQKLLDLYDIVQLYNKNDDKFVKRYVDGALPVDFLSAINNYNIFAIANQLKYILKTNINIRKNLTNEDINCIKNVQCIYSLGWCVKYDFNINKKSRYLDLDLKYNYMPNFF
uniref:Ribosomal RNA methyltransferase FtsJ domain-containing protein n=1 Tax=viral metagenome TaxID=1070528 RepID=A0A6C0B562_9ZZZZ